MSMVFVCLRSVLVLIVLASTALWGLDSQDAATLMPGARYNHGMTYDDQNGRVLMFGGMDARERLGDLWAWDGRAWSRLSGQGPAPRDFAVFAYDSKRRRTILFGGRATSQNSPGSTLDDTWEWDGVAWTEKPVAGPTMLHPIGAYDKRRERLVVYGGLSTTGGTRGQWLTDTWEWDGDRWSRRSNAGVEGVPNQMVYDERRKQVVMVAVESVAQADRTQRSALWCWNGLEWRRVTDGWGDPAFAAPKGMTAFGKNGILLFDGAARMTDAWPATWLWNGQRWARAGATPLIPNRTGYALAYDARRKRVVLFGGTAGFAEGRAGEMFADTWEWTGTAWVRVSGS